MQRPFHLLFVQKPGQFGELQVRSVQLYRPSMARSGRAQSRLERQVQRNGQQATASVGAAVALQGATGSAVTGSPLG